MSEVYWLINFPQINGWALLKRIPLKQYAIVYNNCMGICDHNFPDIYTRA